MNKLKKKKKKKKKKEYYYFLYIYISNTNEDKTHFQDHLYFDQLVGLPQGEVNIYKSKSKHTRQRSAVATRSFTPVGDLQARWQDVTFAYMHFYYMALSHKVWELPNS